MRLTDTVLLNYFKWRQKSIEKVISNPSFFQDKLLNTLLDANRNTSFGRNHLFEKIKTYKEFNSAIPVSSYDDLFPLISRMIEGEQNILCHEEINWFAKSSGTSSGKSKYIPVSHNYLRKGHLKCAWDAASFIYHEDPKAKLFSEKSLIMGGSIEQLPSGLMAGDISAIIIKHFPPIGKRFYTPDFETALMNDWDSKIKRMAAITSKENLTLIAGVPTWVLVLIKEVLKQTGKNTITEVWPNIRSFLHGGVSFEPYRKQFESLMPSKQIIYREVYNASEGYFAIQNENQIDGMLLLCDHQLYYEFIPWENGTESGECLPLDEVESGRTYALVITNTSGLYRYKIGDLVQIVSTSPVKIKVIGRDKAMINVFGEELSISNTDQAIAELCNEYSCAINEYTVGPVFLDESTAGRHEWMIEFEIDPEDSMIFSHKLDEKLCQLNSDYEAKRSAGLVLKPLIINQLPKGTFERWMRSKGRYGGQTKVPRLKNDRSLIDELYRFLQNTN